MSAVPRLLAGKRRRQAALLLAMALGEALLAVLLAAALDRLVSQNHPMLMAVLAASGIAALTGAAMLLKRWVGEDIAKSHVDDCRAILLETVANRAAQADNGRWLSVLVHDMPRLCHHGLRGTLRLWTGGIAVAAVMMWQVLAASGPASLPGKLLLLGFIALRLGDCVSALGVWASGCGARLRLERLIAPGADPAPLARSVWHGRALLQLAPSGQHTEIQP